MRRKPGPINYDDVTDMRNYLLDERTGPMDIDRELAKYRNHHRLAAQSAAYENVISYLRIRSERNKENYLFAYALEDEEIASEIDKLKESI